MFKIIIRSLLLGLVAALIIFKSVPSQAALTQVPGKISAPVILYDEGGNTLATGDYGILVSLKDDLGNALYTEEHVVRVKDGVAQIILGEGSEPGSEGQKPTGGLVLDSFMTSGVVNVEILVEGQFSPQEISVLGSQPYAFVAQQSLSVATDAILSASIKDGSITSDDISSDYTQNLITAVLAQVPAGSQVPTTAEIINSLVASKIAVSANIGLKNASGLNIEAILKGLDQAIETLREIHLKQGLENLDKKLIDALNLEIANRIADVNAEEAARSVKDTDLQNQVDVHQAANLDTAHPNGSLPTTRLSGQIQDNQIVGSLTRDGEVISLINNSTGRPVSGAKIDNINNIFGILDDGKIAASIARDSELPTVITDHGDLGGLGDDDHTQYLLVNGVRAMGGNLAMGGNEITNVTFGNSTTSVGAKLFELQNRVDQFVTPPSYVLKSGDTMTGSLTAPDVTVNDDLNIGRRISGHIYAPPLNPLGTISSGKVDVEGRLKIKADNSQAGEAPQEGGLYKNNLICMWASLTRENLSNNSPARIYNSFNVDEATRVLAGIYEVKFDTAMNHADYIVTVTPEVDTTDQISPTVYDKTASGFRVKLIGRTCNCPVDAKFSVMAVGGW